MPGFPELTDIEVAQVKVFVTNSFGNNQGFVSYQQVAKELQDCK
jgi:hypothetical protein